MTDTNLREKVRAVFLVALMIGSVFGAGVSLSGSAVAASNTLVVDADGEVGSHTSIGSAVSDADSGDTIEVWNGTYNESVTIDTNNVTIVSNSGAGETVINGTDQHAVTVSAPNVTIDGFTFTSDAQDPVGVYVENGETQPEGYQLGGHQGLEVVNNEFNDLYRGINASGVPGSGFLDISPHPVYEGNEFTANTEAIKLGGPGGSPLGDVTGNDFANSGDAIHVDVYYEGQRLDFVDAQDNHFQSDNDYGVNVDKNGNDIGLTNQVDAGSNWWGDATGPGGEVTGQGAGVSANVSYSPFYVDEGQTALAESADTPDAPGLVNAEVLDNDEDGDIDNVSVTFNDTIDDSTVEASDFSIADTEFDNVEQDSDGYYDNTFTLTLDEEDVIDGTGTQLFEMSGEISDLAGNTISEVNSSKVSDEAAPVVEAVSFDPAVVNRSNFDTPVTVELTFSEDGLSDDGGTIELSGEVNQQFSVDSIDGNTLTATTTDNVVGTGVDAMVDFNVVNAVSDDADEANTQVEYADSYEVDLERPELNTSTVTTIDSNEDGTVDRLEVDFDDNLDDDSVDAEDFTITDPSGDVASGGVSTGETADDNVIMLNVTGFEDNGTGITPNLTVAVDSIRDTAGNLGPSQSDERTQEATDGASPMVTGLTVNDTNTSAAASENVLLNGSDIPTTVEVNATFSENVTDAPTVTIVGPEGDIGTETPDASDGEISVESDEINVASDWTDVYVNVSDGGDGSNDLVAFNESRITVDTQAPNVTVDATPIEGIVNGTVDISDNVSVSDAGGIDVIEVAVDDGDGYESYGEFASESELNNALTSFETSQFDDGTITIQVNATDEAGNLADNETGSMSVDNTAPVVTINEPAETKASQSGGVLDVNVSVDEPNLVDENATVELTNESGGVIQYNVSVDDVADNEFSLRLNTSANASANGARLPNQSATNTTFDTQTLYDLSVTVEDKTDKPATTETMEDALFLDDTAPASFTLFEPSDEDPTEYDLTDDEDELSDEIQIAYGYTEDNTDTVTVELTNESGTVASTQVDDSLYVDDGVVKSFELDLVDSFDDAGTLADGQYNVTVTVTDLAGNQNSSSTSTAPVYINDESPDDVAPVFEESANAEATLNETTEEVTVDVGYNITVPEVEDPGSIDDVNQDSLENVAITSDSDLVTLTVEYYDESAGEYVTSEQSTTNFTISDANATENASVTETATIDLADIDTDVTEDDRVLSRSVAVTGDVYVTAVSDFGGVASTHDDVTVASTTLEQQDAVVPDIESVEVDGPDMPSDRLTITFDRPIEAANGDVASDDFSYEDVSGDQTNYVTSVDPLGHNTVNVTLAHDVNASDVGSDVVGIQPDVLQNSHSGENVPAVNGTVDETDAPAFINDKVDVGENASTVDVTFDQPVVAEDGGALTAANFTYDGDADVVSVDHSAESDTATVHLDSEVTDGELNSSQIEAHDVSDRFDNVASDGLSVTVIDATKPSNIEILEPSEQQIKQSGDLLDVSYQYVDNVPDNVENAEIRLVDENGETYTYSVDDTSYVANVSKSLTLDLSENDESVSTLADGVYNLTIEVEDASDNSDTATFENGVVVNDEAPDVTFGGLNATDNVAPGDDVNVTFDLADAADVTNVDVSLVQDGEAVHTTSFSGFTPTGTEAYERTITVPESIADNEAYTVSVEATDESGFTGSDASDWGLLDVNAEAPSIESVEANAGSNTVAVTFTEAVEGADGEINATDFAYQDVSGTASGIESATQVAPDTVELTLDADVTADDLHADLINVRSGAIHDTADIDVRTEYVYAVSEFVQLDAGVSPYEAHAQPHISDADTQVGLDVVRIEFNSPVEAPDGNVSADDFVWKDGNDAGASTIVSVERADQTDFLVTLDQDLTQGDAESDEVKVKEDTLVGGVTETYEPSYAGPRYASSGEAFELNDTTDPSVGPVDAGAINANNEGSYDVTVDTTSEVTDVSVTLNGTNGTELSDSANAVEGDAKFTFDASALEDGPVDVDVEVTDAGGNNASVSTTTVKDTDAPTIEVAAANPGGSADAGGKTRIVTVAFSEAVDSSTVSADAFTITSDQHSVDDIINSPFITADNEVLLLLNQSVTPAAIDNGSVAQVEAGSVTDEVGNSVTNAVNLTDEPVNTGSGAAPSYTPGVTSLSAEAGDENVTIEFDEVVEAGDGGDLTAANFTYTDANDANASAVDSVTQTGPQTVVVTLDAALTDSDLAYDLIGVGEDAVFDTSGNAMPASNTTFDLNPGLSASAGDDVVTVQVTTMNDIETAVGDGLTVQETNLELASLEGFTLEDRFTANVSAEDFTEVEPGVYEASVDVPGDDQYTVSGLVDGELATQNVVVDQDAPRPSDAVILDVTSEAQLDEDAAPNTTRVRVLFSEPIDASEIMPSDVSIENFGGEVVAVEDGGLFGSVEIVVEGKIQTGTSPDVTIDGDSYTDLAGTSGQSEGDTVVHTDTLQLSEGQNFVSVPAAAGELSLSELDTSAVDAIYAYDAASESWEAYDPDAPSNDFTSLEGGEGYIFVMDADATIDVNVYNIAGADAGADATAPAPNQQTLTEGWNLIGHFQEYDQPVDTALSSVGMSSVFELYAQSDSSATQSYESYHAGDFSTMERGEAYWVFVTHDEVYTEANSGHTTYVSSMAASA